MPAYPCALINLYCMKACGLNGLAGTRKWLGGLADIPVGSEKCGICGMVTHSLILLMLHDSPSIWLKWVEYSVLLELLIDEKIANFSSTLGI